MIGTPLVNRIVWFTYIDGTTLRENCVDGQPIRARFVYNADFQRQVRIYNLVGDGADGAFIKTRVQQGRPIDISQFTLENPLGPLGGWEESLARVSPDEFDNLMLALRASGAFTKAPVGLQLQSSQYFWLSAICKDGDFYFHAWLEGRRGAVQPMFPDLLFAQDLTEVTVRPAQRIGAEARLRPGPGKKDQKRGPQFTLQVAADGLVGP